MKKCILFDIDGTLIDSEDATIESLKLTMKKLYNKNYDEKELSFAIGLPGEHTLVKLGVKDVTNALLYWWEKIRKFSDKIRVYPQIEKVLDILKDKKIKLGIITSRCDFEIKEDIVLKKILNYFDVIVAYKESLKPKPYPDQLLKALEELNIEPRDAIYIGDTRFDYECAKSAKVDFILANWGKLDRKSNFDDNNIQICNNPIEILNYIETQTYICK